MHKLKAFLICWVFLSPGGLWGENYFQALEAMKMELARSFKNLRLEDSPPPYFMAYRLTANDSYSVYCSYGSIGREQESKQQIPFVEVRVGSYDLDNTWEGFATSEKIFLGSRDMDAQTLRQLFWYLTDSGYKNALRKYLDKKARLAQELLEEKIPDFSKEKPQKSLILKEEPPSLDREKLREACRLASLEFKKYPEVDFGYISAEYQSEVRVLVNSEGTEIIQGARYTPYAFFVRAEARAPDNLAVDSFRSVRFRTNAEMPDKKALSLLVEEAAQEVADLKKAPVQMPELAPALLDGESTGVFFHEALGHRLEGQRQREAGELQTFKNKVGTRIIPSFLSVYSDPTIRYFGGQPISGYYDFDSEGVPSQRVALVSKGILKSYLMSRRPIGGFLNSNGSGRSDADSLAEGRMSVLTVESSQALEPQKLRKRFLEEIRRQGKAFGFRLIAMRSGEAQTSRGSSQSFVSRPRLIYRVERDGRETLIRGLEYVGTPLSAIEKILAAGSDQTVTNAFCGASSGWIPVTQITPSVVLSELELQRQPEDRFRPPILGAPLFETKSKNE